MHHIVQSVAVVVSKTLVILHIMLVQLDKRITNVLAWGLPSLYWFAWQSVHVKQLCTLPSV